MQTRVIEELFAAYFENEEDISDINVLTACGVKAGLTRDEVTEWMAGDKGGSEVDKEVQNVAEEGIMGVPNYTINGVYNVSGAQDSSVFLHLLRKAREADVK